MIDERSFGEDLLQFTSIRLLSPCVGRGVRGPEDHSIWGIAHGPIAARSQERYPVKPPYRPQEFHQLPERATFSDFLTAVPAGATILLPRAKATILGVSALGPQMVNGVLEFYCSGSYSSSAAARSVELFRHGERAGGGAMIPGISRVLRRLLRPGLVACQGVRICPTAEPLQFRFEFLCLVANCGAAATAQKATQETNI